MSIAHLLDDFGSLTDGHTVSISDLSLEDERLDSYEAGYKAGWEDAVKAQEGDSRRVASDLANNLEDLTFTITEATQSVLRDLRPLLEDMVNTVLPRLAQDTLGARVVELLEVVASTGAEKTVEITTSPSNLTALELLTEGIETPRVTVLSEDTFADGQVHIQMGAEEREIDLDALMAELQTAVAGFFDAQGSSPGQSLNQSFTEREIA